MKIPKCKYCFYYVIPSDSMFGGWFFDSKKIKVCAYSPEGAVNKYLRKSQAFSEIGHYASHTTSQWGKFRVTPVDKHFERFAVYIH